MGKIGLKIPEKLDDDIDAYLIYSGLENRDKSRLILFAVEKMIQENAPPEFKNRCQEAKAAIKAKQKLSWGNAKNNQEA